MSYHSYKMYLPDNAKKGDTFRCMCSVQWQLVRTFPWKKWVVVRKEDRP